MEHLEAQVIRTGSSQAVPATRQLRAGPLLATLEEGALRSIRLLHFPQYEVLHGIYAAVRDHDWNTVEPRFLSYEVEAREDTFQVRFVAEHRAGEVDFVWQGTINGSSAGEIVFTFDGQARRAFRKNRIGFCVLHSMELAGNELEIETPAGMLRGTFPVSISPHQPYKEITAMRYTCAPASTDRPEIRMELRFSGELFEMEDQRNWTDASYKTYCTPLSLPYPVEIAAGTRIAQSVTLRPLSYPVAQARPAQVVAETPRVEVSTTGIRPLPALGFGLARHATPWSSGEIARLRALRPDYLWVELDLAHPDWQETLVQAQNDAALLQTDLELAIVCDDEGQELEPLFHRLAEQQLALACLWPFSRTTHVTTRAMLEEARIWRTLESLTMPLGAGSRANFAEFNRADLPLDLAEQVNYALNPQVHAFDHRSLVETLPAQAVTASNALRIAAGRALSVGPVTLKPRFNAVAATPEGPAEQAIMPDSVDPRQMSLFGASWTVGSLRRLIGAGVHRLTYFETTGWRGLLEQVEINRPHGPFLHLPGALFPLYHVFADLAEFRRGKLLTVDINAAWSIEALAVRRDQRLLLLIANTSGEQQSLQVHLPPTTNVHTRVLDETTAMEAMYEPTRFRSSSQRIIPDQTGLIAIDLLPFAVMHIEGLLQG